MYLEDICSFKSTEPAHNAPILFNDNDNHNENENDIDNDNVNDNENERFKVRFFCSHPEEQTYLRG